MTKDKFHWISVVVPVNPFTPPELSEVHHCLCALDVMKLMEWWPGLPHSPHQDPKKVKAIQRSLDWKRVALIGAYLLQEEIEDSGDLLNEIFGLFYHPRKMILVANGHPKSGALLSMQEAHFLFFPMCLYTLMEQNFTRIKPQVEQPRLGLIHRQISFSLL